jgi:hypothetical protein
MHRPETIRGYSANTWYGVAFDIFADLPVYHRLRVGHSPKGVITVCGREVGVYRPLLPLKHLEKFARLCKGCCA